METLTKQGAIPSPGSSEELARDMRAELDRWEKLVRQANVSLR
ncbi:MAG: hypothetical protein ROZ64_03015 [Burkholderiaceae bacterium]|nr:hypothetical protein [Burkholderiaceae bacterium]